MASLASQHQAAAIFYSVLGRTPSLTEIDTYGQQLQTGAKTPAQLAQAFISSSSGAALYGGKTDSEILQIIYTREHGAAATEQQLTDYLAANSLSSAVSNVVNDLLNYSGSDSTLLSQQAAFENKIDTLLYPSTATSALGQGASDIQAILYVVGSTATADAVNYFGAKINAGMTLTQAAAANISGRSYLTSLTDDAFIARLFQFGYERAPTSAEASSYLSLLQGGATRADVLVDIIQALRGTVGAGDQTAQQHFNSATTVYQAGHLPGLSYQEQVAAVYLGVAERGVDASGLDTWSKQMAAGTSYSTLIGKLVGSAEFQRKGGQLTGDDFIQHVFSAVHGVAATAGQLATYSALGSDKSLITQAIINDLRTSTATDAATVTQQHGFEFDIGTSLLYKTAASLTATAAGGNATGTVNTGASHQISNAETAVLTDVQLAANAASVVNLKFADHLANLTINGTSAATVNLSDNGVNPGVDITVNNGNVILNASSGADDVLVTATAAVATATGDFNLGAGNDSLKWLGNAAVGGANTVGAGISGNGGDGVDTISANFITKNVVMSGNAVVRTATITSNASQFTNFEKIDLAGYIGKATVNTGSTAANHTFDFGLLTGNAVSESSTTGLTNNVVQAATSNIGSQGFVLSGLAEAVKVINAAGGNSAQLEVTGNATAASSVEITFLQNATNHFNVTFDAVSSTDVNAGSLALNSSSSVLLPTVLSTLNIASGGTGNFDNILSLTGTNAQVQNIAITGDHVLDLTVGSGFSNVRDINATANTAGLNLDSSHAGTGDGIIVQLLNILPLSVVTTGLLAPVLTALGLNGYQLNVEGTGAADSFSVLGNTTLAGGNGVNTYDLKSSTTQAGVTITDFDSTKDKIVDAASALTISGDTSGTAVADYGTRASDTLDALLGTLVGGLTNGVIGLLGGILGLDNSNSLTAKVGVASVVFGGTGNNDSSYVIIDNNNNHTLDTSDSVVYLTGQNHQQLLDTLHYA
ncbi:beta strand repeat-containing protein [Serratia sp. NA_112.1]|uniref:beta strand repeat-containing protein n=1 Tax=unclassified Serratia (in: enterobacteria) TaxID=2647522 RepID=UPI004047020D